MEHIFDNYATKLLKIIFKHKNVYHVNIILIIMSIYNMLRYNRLLRAGCDARLPEPRAIKNPAGSGRMCQKGPFRPELLP